MNKELIALVGVWVIDWSTARLFGLTQQQATVYVVITSILVVIWTRYVFGGRR